MAFFVGYFTDKKDLEEIPFFKFRISGRNNTTQGVSTPPIMGIWGEDREWRESEGRDEGEERDGWEGRGEEIKGRRGVCEERF